MPVPSKTPDRAGAVTAAQFLVSTHAVSSFCCGIAPIFAFAPAFLLPVVYSALRLTGMYGVFWLAVLLIPIAALAYAVVTVRLLGDGDRRGRFAVTGGLIVVVALASAGTLSWSADGVEPWPVLATAAPSLLAQVIAWICVRSRSAARWFQECEAYRSQAGPEA